MSNVMAAVDVPDVPLMVGLVLLLAPAAVAVGIMWWLGVFRAQSIQGPSRLGRDESAWLLLFILMVGIVLAVIVTQLMVGVSQPSEEVQMLMTGIVLTTAGFFFILIGNVLLRRHGLERLGFTFQRLPKGLLLGLVGIVLMLPLVYLCALAVVVIMQMLELGVPTPHPVLERLAKRPEPWIMALLFFSAVVVASLGEELIFRGMLQTILVRLFGFFGSGSKASEGGGGTPQRAVLSEDTPPSVEQRKSVPMDAEAELRGPSPAGDPINRAEGGDQALGVVQPRDQAVSGVSEGDRSSSEAGPGARWAAIMVTSVLFALAHEQAAHAVPLILLSLGLGYSYERTGNLWVPVSMHAAFNGIQMVVSLLVLPG